MSKVVPKPKETAPLLASDLKGNIFLKDVKYSYRKSRYNVAFECNSLAIKEGSRVALLGRSGSGKSSLLKLIAGQLTPNVGRVEVGGVPVENLKTHGFSNLIQYVGERTIFNAGSVSDNLFGDAKRDLSEIAEIWGEIPDWALRFPRGFDQPISESGEELTRFDRTSLAFLIALRKRPSVLIVDDVFRGMEPILVDRIFNALKRTSRNMTIFVSGLENSVRASTAQEFADRLLVIEYGRIKLDELKVEGEFPFFQAINKLNEPRLRDRNTRV